MQTVVAPNGARGFDVNSIIDLAKARALALAGYRFALRYVPRVSAHPNDLTASEVAVLHDAGLAVMVVQHVESETSWTPTKQKGTDYGTVAAQQAKSCGLTQGTSVWLDLEGVALDTPVADVIAYCNAWYDAVKMARYLPGLYIGYHDILNAAQLYQLKFTRYWAAYNLNTDQYPAVRGVCLRQYEAEQGDAVLNVHGDIAQYDVVQTDASGDLPVVCAPNGWDNVP